MAASDKILFISAGILQPKKRDHLLARRQLYLNYGALTLATLLESNGRPTILVHGEHEDPADFLERLEKARLLPSRWPVMLSLPSFYALGWAKEFCRRLKGKYPESRIVAGGRWVTGPDPLWLRGKIPQLDEVVPGLGEPVIGRLAHLPAFRPSDTGRTELPHFPLDHRLVDGFAAFQPSIETSRGCGMGCAFCEERAIPLSKLRDPALLAEYVRITIEQYQGGEIHPYLQSSFFAPSTRWAAEFQKETERNGARVAWRCETRVDGMKADTVAHLAAAGMRAIDLGLETASPRQIMAMNKSGKIERYLRSASDLIEACHANGVWVKVNVLLYAGETASTVAETRQWLDDHRDRIKGVSVGPVVVYGPPVQAHSLLEDLEARGARAVDRNACDISGITAIHLSREIDADAAEQISLELSRRYMTVEDYFDLKSFSYYPRGYDRTDFDADVAASDRAVLPFRFSPGSHQRASPTAWEKAPAAASG